MIDFARAFTRNDVRVVGAGGVLLGGVAGFLISGRHYKKKYEALANEEIASVKERYGKLRKEGAYSNPTEAKEALIGDTVEVEVEVLPKANYQTKVEALGYSTEEEPESKVIHAEKVVVRTNEYIQDDEPGPFGPRDPDKPYIISVEEFMEGREDIDQLTITYFEGDDTLVDEREQIIPDHDYSVGQHNLNQFGKGLSAKDEEHVLYIRNERLSTDFEVVRETGKYAVIVLGMRESDLETDDRSLKHSRSRRTYRDDD